MSTRNSTRNSVFTRDGKLTGFKEFTELARRKAPAALERIEKLAKSHPDAAIRLAADKVLLERAWGRPITPVAVNAETLGTPQFVIRTPAPIATATDWEKTVELERSEYEARALPAPGASPAAQEASSLEPEAEQQAPTVAHSVVVVDLEPEEPEAEFCAPAGGFTAPA